MRLWWWRRRTSSCCATRCASRIHVQNWRRIAWDRRSARSCTNRRIHRWTSAKSLSQPMGRSGSNHGISFGPNSFRDIPESDSTTHRWRCRKNRMLGALRRSWKVPSLCNQLCSPRMPSSLVRAIEIVHVPMPRRGVLPRWISCGRTATARSL